MQSHWRSVFSYFCSFWAPLWGFVVTLLLIPVRVLAFDKKDGPLTPDEEEQRCTIKRKVLGNIRFIGKCWQSIINDSQ